MDKEQRIKELVKELEGLGCIAEQHTVTYENGKEVKKDKTKGIIKEEVRQDVSSLSEQGFVIEKADSGRGFQFYKDYSKDTSGKLKRLVR